MKWGKYAFTSMLFALVFFLAPSFVPAAHAAATNNVSKITAQDLTTLFQQCTGSATSRDSKSTDYTKIYAEMVITKPCTATTGDFTLSCDATTFDGTSGASSQTCNVSAKSDGSSLSMANVTDLLNSHGAVNTQDSTGATTGKGVDANCSGSLAGTEACKTSTPPAGPLGGGNCSFATGSLGDCIVSIVGYIVAGIEWVILFVVSGILGLANYLLGWTVYVTVYQFGNLVGNSEGLLAAWGVVRDVGNLVLLFGFIFMGISTILNLPHSEFTAKKALPRLIIFAVLLNFSLIVAEGVIDVSNALATSVYNAMGGVCTNATGTADCVINGGIGGAVMNMSGIISVFSFSKDGLSIFTGGGITSAVIYAGLIIFVVITTIVLAAAAVMLLIRALILAFLMVTSPLGFAGMAIPPLQEVAKKWWDQLIHQAFFAPIYFLLVLVSLKVMEGVITALGGAEKQANGVNNLAAVFVTNSNNGSTSNITITITFALLIGFMIAALMFAKRSAALGSGMAISAGGSFAFGTLGFVGRQTAGRASLLAANRIRTSSFGQTGLGRMAFNAANKGASSSFDYRQGGPGRKALTSVAGDLGSVRKSVQHGMHGIEEDKKKAKVDYAKQITQSHDEIHREDELRDNIKDATKRRKDKENERRPMEEELQTKVRDQERENADNRAARAAKIAEVQTKLNNAVASGTDATGFKDELDQLFKDNSALTGQENAELESRRQALSAHKAVTKQALETYDKEIARYNAQISGGEAEDESGKMVRYEGISTDAKRKRYGENMRDSVLSRYAGHTIAGHTDFEAGRDVIRNAGKTKLERALDDIKSERSTNDGGTPHAPAPAPTGGGGHAPAH